MGVRLGGGDELTPVDLVTIVILVTVATVIMLVSYRSVDEPPAMSCDLLSSEQDCPRPTAPPPTKERP